MLIIKKGPMIITRTKNDIKVASDTHDGIYFKFQDNVEIIFTMALSPALKALIGRIEQMSAQNIEINLDDHVNPIKVS
jgi:hypothetical protein